VTRHSVFYERLVKRMDKLGFPVADPIYRSDDVAAGGTDHRALVEDPAELKKKTRSGVRRWQKPETNTIRGRQDSRPGVRLSLGGV
jgi:hypothetical protein